MTFIVIEGQDYVGKSTQVQMLVNRLQKEGYEVLRTRSPGGCTPDAEAVRHFMLTSISASPDLRNILAGLCRKLTTSVLNDFLHETPTHSKVVVSDRWTTSGYAYQVAGEGVRVDKFLEANTDVIIPNLEIRLVMSEFDRALRKQSMESTNRDVMEVAESDPAFAKRIQNVFADNDISFADRTVTIHLRLDDSPEQIHEKIWNYVQVAIE